MTDTAGSVGTWRWGRAGVRLSDTDRAHRRRVRARRQAEDHRRAERDRQDSYERWELGLVVPWRITVALDAGTHVGPEVDLACGVVEPTVDEWETGRRYPTFEQLTKLSDLTGYPLDWFVSDAAPLDIRDTTLWGHMTERDRQRWKPPVLEFEDAAVSVCPGTAAYRECHLF